MKLRFLVVGILLIVAAYLLDHWSSSRSSRRLKVESDASSAGPIVENIESALSNPSPRPATESPATETSAPPKTERARTNERPRVAQLIPPVAKLREEVAASPHTTPPSLVRFALDLGQRLQAAEKSESEATLFFGELETCVMDKAQVHSARAMCLMNAERLTQTFSGLQARAVSLRQRVEPEVSRLADQ